MDLQKLGEMIEYVLEDIEYASLESGLWTNRAIQIEFQNILNNATIMLPDHKGLFKSGLSRYDGGSFTIENARTLLHHILKLVRLEEESKSKIKELKLFDSAYDKMEQANIAYQDENYPSVLSNLNTALELVLKNKIDIPITITKINTNHVIDVLVKEKVDFHPYLTEVKNKILRIDNKVKHQGYKPTKVDCINAIGCMEGLMAKMRDRDITLSDSLREKIYKDL